MSNKKLNKVCIFCGEKPENKNKEHVIPQWLIKLTGEKKRPFSLYLFDKENGYSKNESTPFDQFVFPACTKCNSNYSELENKASIVINSLINMEPLDSCDFTVLLDWLDKVRIGIWLAIRYRDNNAFQFEPNFYISQRQRKSDRLVRITRTSQPAKRLTLSGVNTPAFMKMPSAFALTINQFSLISVSGNFLLSRRMGWPHPEKTVFHENGLIECDMTSGLERVIQPIIRLPIENIGTIILQSVIPSEIYNNQKELYESKFILESCLNEDKSLSKIYIQKSSQHSNILANHKNKEWVPPPVDLESNKFSDKSGVESLKIQNQLWSEVLGMEFNSKEHKKAIRNAIAFFQRFNKEQISNIEKKVY